MSVVQGGYPTVRAYLRQHPVINVVWRLLDDPTNEELISQSADALGIHTVTYLPMILAGCQEYRRWKVFIEFSDARDKAYQHHGIVIQRIHIDVKLPEHIKAAIRIGIAEESRHQAADPIPVPHGLEVPQPVLQKAVTNPGQRASSTQPPMSLKRKFRSDPNRSPSTTGESDDSDDGGNGEEDMYKETSNSERQRHSVTEGVSSVDQPEPNKCERCTQRGVKCIQQPPSYGRVKRRERQACLECSVLNRKCNLVVNTKKPDSAPQLPTPGANPQPSERRRGRPPKKTIALETPGTSPSQRDHRQKSAAHVARRPMKYIEYFSHTVGNISELADQTRQDIQFEPLTADMRNASKKERLEVARHVMCLKALIEERLFELYRLEGGVDDEN